jgi:hypothetical protein
MGMSRWRRQRWQWLQFYGDYSGGGDGACTKIRVDRRLRIVVDDMGRGGEWVGVGCWRVKNGTS